MYQATISVEDKNKILKKCFSSEDKDIKKASYKVREDRGKTFFDIKAGDSVALRTVLNSITKMLTVIEKMGKIK
ncbi:hypothetical protein CMO88_02565 [Candidatus Woesearchaeota archaeon]|nr:hypothetical protein [Candidatus Woesearchaeota archaeon]|tara:strand:+ start:294 stop:515 length:222 start_codon:yes stop_codon:yes gene_type:complete